MIRNSPPEIVSSPPEKIDANLFSYPVKINDLDNDPIALSLNDSPKGMAIDQATSLIT